MKRPSRHALPRLSSPSRVEGRAGWPQARKRGSLLCALALSCGLSLQAQAARADAYDDEVEPPAPIPIDPESSSSTDPAERPLSAGGLDAPGTLPEAGEQRTEIERELEEADRRDARRGLDFVWLSGELGFQAVDLTAIQGELAGESVGTSGSGLVVGGGLGLRVLYFTLGARFRMGLLGEYELWSLLGEAAMRLPLGHWEPYASLGLGYTSTSGFGAGILGRAQDASGLDLRVGLGTDYYLSDTFSVGAQVAGDMLFLSRGVVEGSSDPILSEERSAVGLGVVTSLLIGLHF